MSAARPWRWRRGLALVALIVAAAAPAFAAPSCAPLAVLSRATAALHLTAPESAALRRFYGDAGAPCRWRDDEIATLRAVLARSGDQGLDPARYHDPALASSQPQDQAGRDLAATAMALRYAHDMVMGRVDLAAITRYVAVPRPRIDLPRQLAEALAAHRLQSWLDSLPPAEPGYRRLLQAYRAFRERLTKPQPPPVPPGPTLKQGDVGPRVALFKARLRASGDLRAASPGADFDSPTRAALMAFQRRHGLAVDGRFGKASLASLDVPAATRLRQIALNLERWRYFGHVLPATRIAVNTAAATARLVIAGHTVLAMRAIVGDRRHPTPILISPAVAAIVLNPPWVVPKSIIRHEISPRLGRDPGYLARHNMRWVGDQLVQVPGPRNSLGRIKFDFPSPFAVYLHDTPARSLFEREDRAKSHGCVRLAQPLALALALLKGDSAWPKAKVEAAIKAGATIRIPLAHGPAVVIAYWTAFVDDDGTLEFRDDVYHRDAALAAALAGRAPSAPPRRIADGKIGCHRGAA